MDGPSRLRLLLAHDQELPNRRRLARLGRLDLHAGHAGHHR